MDNLCNANNHSFQVVLGTEPVESTQKSTRTSWVGVDSVPAESMSRYRLKWKKLVIKIVEKPLYVFYYPLDYRLTILVSTRSVSRLESFQVESKSTQKTESVPNTISNESGNSFPKIGWKYKMKMVLGKTISSIVTKVLSYSLFFSVWPVSLNSYFVKS